MLRSLRLLVQLLDRLVGALELGQAELVLLLGVVGAPVFGHPVHKLDGDGALVGWLVGAHQQQ